VAYVPRRGTLWELDGLREGPIPLCEAHDGDWLDKVSEVGHVFELRGGFVLAAPHLCPDRPAHAPAPRTTPPNNNRSARSCSRASTSSRRRERSAST
jgi:hypothetical protein